MKRASVSLLLCTGFVLPAQDVSIGRQRHVGSRHTCPSYAYMCRDDGGGIDAFIRNAHVHLITSFIRYLYNVTQWAVLDMRMGRLGC